MHKISSYRTNGYNIFWYNSLTSTNNKAVELALKNEPEGIVVVCNYQTKGKGQRENSWESEDGKNLTFSILMRPVFLPAEKQFILSKIVSLAVYDYLKSINIEASIKWPNDIYIEDRKVTGILIENSIMGENISFSVAGIGLNLNQKQFSNKITNPISVIQKTGIITNIKDALNNLLLCFDRRYKMLKNGKLNDINTDYFNALYRSKGYHLYKQQCNEKTFKAKIKDVLNTGELILEDENGITSQFAFKEIIFVLP